MSSKHRFTYAGTARGVGKRVRSRYAARAPLPRDWKTLNASVASPGWGQHASARLPLRFVVAALLVVICFAVISKEPAMHDQLAKVLGSAGEWLGQWHSTPKPAEPVAPVKPVTQAQPMVVEAVPLGFVPLALISDGGIFALGQHGEVKNCTAECTAEHFPLVTGAKVQETPGQLGVILTTNVDMSLIRRLLSLPWAERLSEIHVGALPELVLYTREGTKIKVDVDQHLDRQLRRLALVCKDLEARGQTAMSLDARYQDQIVVRPRGRR